MEDKGSNPRITMRIFLHGAVLALEADDSAYSDGYEQSDQQVPLTEREGILINNEVFQIIHEKGLGSFLSYQIFRILSGEARHEWS